MSEHEVLRRSEYHQLILKLGRRVGIATNANAAGSPGIRNRDVNATLVTYVKLSKIYDALRFHIYFINFTQIPVDNRLHQWSNNFSFLQLQLLCFLSGNYPRAISLP
jgi:hypothetical protein